MGAREDILGFLSSPPENGRLFYTTQEISQGVERGRTATHRALQRLHRWGLVERQVAWRARSGRVMRLIWAATPQGKKVVKRGGDRSRTTHVKGLAPVLILLVILFTVGCVIDLDGISIRPAVIWDDCWNTVYPGYYELSYITYGISPCSYEGTFYHAYASVNFRNEADITHNFRFLVSIDGAAATTLWQGDVSAGALKSTGWLQLGSEPTVAGIFAIQVMDDSAPWDGITILQSAMKLEGWSPDPTTTSTATTTTSTTQPATTTSQPTTITTTITTTTPGWASILVTATGGGSTPISNLQVNVYQDGGVIAYKSDTTDSQGKASFSVEPGHSYTVKGTLDGMTMSNGPTTLQSGSSWQPTLNWPMVTATSPPPTTWSGTGTPQPTTVVIDAGQFEGMTTDTMMLIGVFLMFVAIVVALRFRL